MYHGHRSVSTAYVWLVVASCFSAIGCGDNRQAGTTVERDGEPPFQFIKPDDSKMNRAIAQARSSVRGFVRALQNPAANQSDFSVKVPVDTGSGIEHMWLTSVRHQHGKFTGLINNEPVEGGKVKLGDEVTFGEQEISDWMYVENDKLVGGYTIRALRDSMDPEERAKLDSSLPFAIE